MTNMDHQHSHFRCHTGLPHQKRVHWNNNHFLNGNHNKQARSGNWVCTARHSGKRVCRGSNMKGGVWTCGCDDDGGHV